MPALNFSPQFADAVKRGEKRQTIRQSRKRPILPCDNLYLYTGLRTKSTRLLRTEICAEVLRIHIDLSGVQVDGKTVDMGAMARADGFGAVSDFLSWFSDHYGLPFDGVLITW